MRFREQQDDARRATQRLLVLFALLLVALVLAVNGLLLGLWWAIGWLLSWQLPLPPLFVETNTTVVLLFVLGGALVELGRLREGGGAHVAHWAGGRELLDARQLSERRLLNIVDEMAIASGLPRPAVYLLDREDAINAFTAGWSPDDAIVAVTQGALDRLTRDELQGLVAHEFGHIHQQDLRLNMQLLALVWGLSLVHGYGHKLLEADEAGRRSAFGLLVGPVFVAAGLLGWLAGQLLQAAVSRQRELLADACAVQFTRSRDGLGGVLRKVWHQAQRHEDRLARVPARLLAAMLLQAPADWLATHPPLRERLRRLYGRTVEPLPAPRLEAAAQADEPRRPTAAVPLATVAALAPIAYAAPMTPAAEPAPAHTPEPRATSPQDEREAIDRLSRLNGPGELRAAILALLATPGSRRERRAWQEETKGLSTAREVRDDVKKLGPATRLPWLDLLLGRVAKAPLPDRQHLMAAARRVMAADGQVRPIDRLHWLLMRQRLGEATPLPPAAGSFPDIAQASLHTRREIARLTAFLARLVPDGEAWYQSVMQPWLSGEALPPCEAPDADGLVHALQEVQTLPWMLKPVLVRHWTETALRHKPPGPLADEACDALRLAAVLLDSPLPPELARHYVEPDVT
ncbi:M48 family metalloprotease [Rhizobacter sp. J219]|uniref:M48 family metalloprotease n=1 Tax=Rhizobacter sp. J219 TaxID=2898430 RepID=UPI00215163D5|nr:M48 family metalloprotease [Rhizobacter sp. J219]MCR5884218.1 M48 family metalloprotease [Rhizobacter sp. J219]